MSFGDLAWELSPKEASKEGRFSHRIYIFRSKRLDFFRTPQEVLLEGTLVIAFLMIMIFLLSTAVQLPGEEYYAAANMDHPPLSIVASSAILLPSLKVNYCLIIAL